MSRVKPQALNALKLLAGEWQTTTGKKIIVNSAYRSPKTNDAVGGAPGSKHVLGIAFDISTTGWNTADKKAFVRMAGKYGFRGFGIGNTIIHIDTRQKPTAWSYNGAGAWQSGWPSWIDEDLKAAWVAAGTSGVGAGGGAINIQGTTGTIYVPKVGMIPSGAVTMNGIQQQLAGMNDQMLSLASGLNTVAEQNISKTRNNLQGDIDVSQCQF